MTTIITTNNNEVEYSPLHLSTTNEKIPKYISMTNTIESKQEIKTEAGLFKNKITHFRCIFNSDIVHIALLYLLYIGYISFSVYLYTTFYQSKADIQARMQFDKRQLTKIPNHLAIHISRELLSSRSLKDWDTMMLDICMATCWAWEFGIQEVSVYDASVDLYKQQSTMLHEWMTNQMERIDQVNHQISVLSGENGKPHMGYVVQEMIKNNKQAIDIELVNTYMHLNTISDPDLMISYDGLPHNYVSLDGYPPWHIRLTEIMNCYSEHQLNYDVFIKCLYKYSKVEQRFGK
ncbi:Decaprenyl diphosphate synthase-like protein [Gilbertella persicaria]|uniref:Decaprenyl diphosphate synthase-like protein n=1 Tax=Gilbertella persicaria TaxID=101096 RepID=UPI002220095A|nr:Decaprenyl diphosphate synthase-like protein [Gilbertella persicaria]KAI8086931.1 Decaprenyl diphosphate synthase-like protein [Gilbertella persicaria]